MNKGFYDFVQAPESITPWNRTYFFSTGIGPVSSFNCGGEFTNPIQSCYVSLEQITVSAMLLDGGGAPDVATTWSLFVIGGFDGQVNKLTGDFWQSFSARSGGVGGSVSDALIFSLNNGMPMFTRSLDIPLVMNSPETLEFDCQFGYTPAFTGTIFFIVNVNGYYWPVNI